MHTEYGRNLKKKKKKIKIKTEGKMALTFLKII